MSRSEREQGFTVPELAVTMMILGVVTLIIFSFLDSTSVFAQRTDENVRTEEAASLALRTIAREVRAANPIGAPCSSGGGYDRCLQFAVQRPSNSHPDCSTAIRYRLTSGSILQDLTDADCPSARSWTGREVIKVVNDPSVDRPFRYFDRLGKEIAIATTCSPDPSQPACVLKAKSVRITLKLTHFRRTGQPIELSTFAALRNSR